MEINIFLGFFTRFGFDSVLVSIRLIRKISIKDDRPFINRPIFIKFDLSQHVTAE